MYHCGGYPDNPIGPVLFLWQPSVVITESEDERGVEGGEGGGGEGGRGGGEEGEEGGGKEESSRALWIWSHPSIFEEVHKVLEEAITLVETGQREEKEKEEEAGKEERRHSSDSQSQNGHIAVTSLKDEMLRFRLLGPLSHQLAMEVLHPATTPAGKEEEEKEEEGVAYLKSCSKWAEIAKSSEDRKWWQKNKEFISQAELVKQHHAMLAAASSPGDFISGTAIGMIVLDPRLSLPKKRACLVSPLTRKPPKYLRLSLSEIVGEGEEDDEEEFKMMEENPFAFADLTVADSDLSEEEEDTDGVAMEMDASSADFGVISGGIGKKERKNWEPGITGQVATLGELPPQLARSPLWNGSVRRSASLSKIPDSIINEIRAEFFVKPATLSLGDEANRVPVILIEKTHQRASSLSPSFSKPQIAGCDLILPAQWGMAFWMSLVYNGGRACGMKEIRSASLESLLPVFPNDFPDCLSGRTAAQEERRMLEEKYRRYPPDKRPNFGKIGVQTPFHAPWGELVSELKRRNVFRQGDVKEEEDKDEPDNKKMKLNNEEEEEVNFCV